MGTLFTTPCEYALRATVYLATQPRHTRLLLPDIALTLNLPPHFLGKILMQLVKRGLLVSKKGRGGGFALARPAEEITFGQVVEAIDGPAFSVGCVLGFPRCDENQPCPAHHRWKQTKETIVEMLEQETLQQLSQELAVKLDSIQGQRADES